MSGMLEHLTLGLDVALTSTNLLYCFIGALVGTLIGILPGLGPTATIAILLPITFGLPPVSALIMLAGIYYGSQYGGSTAAILVNLPGEASSVVTAIDGHPMARQGRAAEALAVAAIGSFFAGCVATLVIAAAALPLTRLAAQFGPAEYFSMMVLGLIASIVISSGSVVKALAMICCGLALGMIGTDVNTGTLRYTFGVPALADGINFVTIAMGVFGIGEILRDLEHKDQKREIIAARLRNWWPGWATLRPAFGSIVRGTALGSVLGVLPGGGGALSSFASYAIEKKLSRTPERFGKGAIQGVAGPESANNAGAQTSFIPMLALGIPSNSVMAMMIGAMMIQGIQPGPLVMRSNPELIWGLIVSMWFGNLMLLVINLPLVGVWMQLLRIPYRIMFPAIVLFCCIGVYTLSNSTVDVVMLLAFGLFGYAIFKLGFEPAPLLLGFILGPMMEENLRRAMLLAGGDPMTFVERPVSLGFLICAAGLLAMIAIPGISRKRAEALVES